MQTLPTDIFINGRKIHTCFLRHEPDRTLANGANLRKDRPVLVFLHDGLGSIAQWKDFPLTIAKSTGYDCLIYDRFGHGLSAPRSAPQDFNYLHDEALIILPQILDHFDLESIILIGHSDGGSIALIFAANFPDKPLKIITLAAHVIVEEETITGIKSRVENYKKSTFRQKLAVFHGEKTDDLFYGWSNCWLSPEFKTWHIVDPLKKIKAPILAVQGATDGYGTAHQLELIKVNVPDALTLLIDDCGHFPHVQAQERTLLEIINFLA